MLTLNKIIFSAYYLNLKVIFVTVLTENKITIDVLKIMSEALISDLIPTIGERAIFLNYWRKHFDKDESNKSNDHHANKRVSYSFKDLFFNLDYGVK